MSQQPSASAEPSQHPGRQEAHDRLVSALIPYVLALLSAGPRSRTGVAEAVDELLRSTGQRNALAALPDIEPQRATLLAGDVLDRAAAVAGSASDPAHRAAIDLALDEAMEDDATWDVGDQLVAYSWLIDGRVFTRRLTAEECESDALVAEVDIDLLDAGPVGPLTTAGGEPVRYDARHAAQEPDAVPEASLLVGPSGWLAGFSADDLVAVQRRGREVHLTKVDTVAEGEAEAGALAKAFDSETVQGVGVEPFTMVMAAIAAEADLFRAPVPPVRELLDRHGIEVRGAWAGRRDEQWVPPGVRYRERQVDSLASRWAMQDCCRTAFELVIEQWDRLLPYTLPPPQGSDSVELPELDPEQARQVSEALEHGNVLPAFLEWGTVEYHLDSAALARLCDALVAAAPSRDTAATLTLRGLVRQARGELSGAESDLAQALRLEPEQLLAMDALARIACDRSDIRRADELVSRLVSLAGGRAAGALDEELLAFLTEVVGSTAQVGRNERCPCGSGRKFKACCLVSPRIPQDGRFDWLVLKLHNDLSRPGMDHGLEELHYRAEQAAGEGVSTYLVAEPAGALIVEAWLFDAGIADYLERRAALLPPGEIEMLREWAARPWGLYEVLDVVAGETVTLRDLSSGEMTVLADATYSTEVDAGAFLLTHVVPDGEGLRLFGPPVDVPRQRVDSALEMLASGSDATSVAVWYGSLYRPPVHLERE